MFKSSKTWTRDWRSVRRFIVALFFARKRLVSVPVTVKPLRVRVWRRRTWKVGAMSRQARLYEVVCFVRNNLQLNGRLLLPTRGLELLFGLFGPSMHSFQVGRRMTYFKFRSTISGDRQELCNW